MITDTILGIVDLIEVLFPSNNLIAQLITDITTVITSTQSAIPTFIGILRTLNFFYPLVAIVPFLVLFVTYNLIRIVFALYHAITSLT